MEIEDKEPLW